MSDNKIISEKIYELLRSSDSYCKNDCDCLVCYLKSLMCNCKIITITKCYDCGQHICEKCENVANNFQYCNDCFISDF